MGKQRVKPTSTGYDRASHGTASAPAQAACGAAPQRKPSTPAAVSRTLARRVGDQRAQWVMAGPAPGRTRLAVNTPGDAYEREADRVADAVMGGAPAGVAEPGGGTALRRCACGGTCASCRGEEEPAELRREEGGAGAETPGFAPAIVHDVLASPGHPLEAGTRTFMEERLGADLDGVRVHTDGRAAESARAVSAHAYTVGADVVFAAGRYAPGTQEGDRLIAHELAHTLQQGPAAETGHAPPPVLRRQGSGRLPPGTHPEVNLDPASVEVILTQAIRALFDIRARGRLTQPGNVVEEVTGVPLGLPRSELDISLAFDDRCNRPLQNVLVRIRQEQAAGRGVFDFSNADWSATAGGGFRIGDLRVDASGQASFHGDQFQALQFVLQFTPGVSREVPEECRGHTPRRPPGGGTPAGGSPPPGEVELCAGIDCSRPAPVGDRDRHRHLVCCPHVGGGTGGTTVTLPPHTLYFFYDTPVLKPDSNGTIDRIVGTLEALPTAHVRITGHTSREGTVLRNEGLSRSRAEAARDLLLMRGISASRIHLLWLGEHAPAVAEPPEPSGRGLRLPEDEAVRDLNRRAEVEFFDPSGTIPSLPRNVPLTLSQHPVMTAPRPLAPGLGVPRLSPPGR